MQELVIISGKGVVFGTKVENQYLYIIQREDL